MKQKILSIDIVSPKGGNGVTTLAALLALRFADNYKKVLLVVSEPQEVLAILGLPAVPPGNMGVFEVQKNVCLVNFDEGVPDTSDFDVLIMDIKEPLTDLADINIVVLRNDYLSLRKSTTMDLDKSKTIVAGYIHEGGVLGIRDIKAVVGRQDVVELEWSTALARTIDAGLLTDRRPQTAEPLYERCLALLGAVETAPVKQ